MQTYLEFREKEPSSYTLFPGQDENVISITERVVEAPAPILSEEKEEILNQEVEPIVEASSLPVEPKTVFESEVIQEVSGYKIYRDKPELFKCDVEISGANLDNSKARIIIEGNELTYMFEGTISNTGQCKIPLKKMNFLDEYEKGKIKLEIIAEDMIFSPWESDFTAVNAKKVNHIKITEAEELTPKVGIKISNINGL